MKRIEHRDEKWAFFFVEYCPENEAEKLPLIIQLHGAGERGNGCEQLERVDVNGFSKYIADKDIKCRFIMPQCPEQTFWAAHVESIVKFVEMLEQEFSVDEDKVYLTGLSMGGYGTWYTAMERPDLFAAIAPVCGGGMAWNAEVLNMPVWAFHGVQDPIVSVTQSDEMVAKLKELNCDVTYQRMEGVEHNVWEYAYNEKLLDWLLSKKR